MTQLVNDPVTTALRVPRGGPPGDPLGDPLGGSSWGILWGDPLGGSSWGDPPGEATVVTNQLTTGGWEGGDGELVQAN